MIEQVAKLYGRKSSEIKEFLRQSGIDLNSLSPQSLGR